ncbi:hypothetical protein L210DRAFT_3432424, partial [Boletus edulis BED1]
KVVDIELGGQEVITIGLDNFDPNSDGVLDLLKEGQCRVSVWAKLAGGCWRRGYLSAAERIAHSAIECTWLDGLIQMAQRRSHLQYMRYLANIKIARAQRAPKLILPDARKHLTFIRIVVDKLTGVRSKTAIL